MNIPRIGVMASFLSMTLILQACATTGQGKMAQSAAPLIIYGSSRVIELAPVLLAVRNNYPAGTVVRNGGVPNLVDADRLGDVATNAETQALRASVKNPDIRIIMTIVDGNYRIVARRSAGITRLADLKGKRIATRQSASAGYFLAKMLKSAGLTASDVTIIHTPLEDMVPGIEKRDIDAIAIWEPLSENAARLLGNDAVEFSGAGIYRELFNLNTTAGALADPVKRREIVSLLRAIIDATAELKRNPADAQALIAKSGGHTLEEVAHSWRHHGFIASFAEDMLDVLVEEEIWLAAQENRPPRSRGELAPLIDRSAYEEALRLPAKR